MSRLPEMTAMGIATIQRAERDRKIERVAKAIFNVSCEEADDGERPINPWDHIGLATREVYTRMAVAALNAADLI